MKHCQEYELEKKYHESLEIFNEKIPSGKDIFQTVLFIWWMRSWGPNDNNSASVQMMIQQTITWTDDGTIHWRKNASTVFNTLNFTVARLMKTTAVGFISLTTVNLGSYSRHYCLSGSVFSQWLNKVSANERIRYICNVFSHWLRPCPAIHRRKPTLGLYSLCRWTSYRKISWSLEAARFGFRLFQSLWNLTAALPRCLSNSEQYYHCNIQSRGFEISQDLTVRRLAA